MIFMLKTKTGLRQHNNVMEYENSDLHFNKADFEKI